MSELHVYRSQCDWWVAQTIDDAWAQMEKHYGETRAEIQTYDELTLLADDETIRVLCEKDAAGVMRPSDGGEYVTKTAAEWAKQEGRGMLCSTEF